MNPNQERIEALFEAARHLASRAEQAAYLDRACGEDAELRRQVEAMLDAEAAADQYFRTAGAPGEAVREAALKTPTASAEPLAEGPGTIIGRYKLLQQIGEGGFGVVYMAEQREPVVRKVALKIIKLGMDTKQVVARFEAERQALALMDHPHIAKVLDAGVVGGDAQRSTLNAQPSAGRPYFVMELVHGIPITAYCDQHNLSPAERLKLLLPVCQAIQHAHQKGIIHRDIKPSNVLVTLNDGVPHPMVIDFGVAKAINQRLTEKTLFTEFGQMIGTPAYMSPEQAEMSKLDVDTRSDVYSLGVLLYELLTGTTPFSEQRLRGAGWAEMQRIITEEEPPRPSTRLSALTEAERTGIAQHRQTDARKLTFLVRGELDWIVMKALEKDRTRRYETANGLAMDIQRYLHDEPVSAVAPSARYRMMKFVRRHRAGLAVTAALFGMLVAGVVVSSWQMVQARQAEKGAVAARGQAEAVSEFLVEAFRSPDPERDGRTVTVAEVLDRATTNLMGRFEDAPELKAALLGALGETYLGLGLYQPAERLVSQSRDLFQRVRGPEDLSTLEAMKRLGMIYEEQSRLPEAEQIDYQTMEAARRLLGPRHRLTL